MPPPEGDCPSSLPLGNAALQILTLVVLFLALAQCQRHLRPPLLEVELERHQGQPLALDGSNHAINLATVEEQFAGSHRIMVVPVSLLVRRDVHTFEEDLAARYPCVGLLDGCLSIPKRLHFRPGEPDAGLPRLENMVVVSCFGISGD